MNVAMPHLPTCNARIPAATRCMCFRLIHDASQGQYWAGRTPPPNNPPPNMAAANFVVITNGEGCALNGTAVAAVLIDQ